jgi:hypothetical protein
MKNNNKNLNSYFVTGRNKSSLQKYKSSECWALVGWGSNLTSKVGIHMFELKKI